MASAVLIDRTANAQCAETGTGMLKRALELVPFLREHAPQSEKLRRLAPQSFEVLRDAGFFKLYVPLAYGGFELTPLETIRIYAALAQGDGAAAWVTTIMATNGWMAAQYSKAVQHTLFESGDIRIVGVLGGGGSRGEARPVEGGYLLSGFWPFCSGCHYAKWVMLGGAVPGADGGQPEQRLFVVRQDQLTIKDDWYTIALAGSGSNSVACDDVFVPSDHALDLGAAAQDKGKAPLYRLNFVNLFAYQLAGPALGFAQAAVEHFVERAAKRGVAYTFYDKQKDAPLAQARLGEAMVKIAAATALAEHDLVDMLETAEADASVLIRGQRRANASYVERLCLEAVEMIFLTAGANSILESSPLQRIWRDIHANNMHGIAALDTSVELLGRLRFGLEPNTYVI